jgi:hypothetical protein
MSKPEALQGIDGYIYSPPAWRVCSDCGGEGSINKGGLLFDCQMCDSDGRTPLRYTPEQWKEAGGVLSDDTPVWVFFTDGEWDIELYGNMSPHVPKGRIIIATSAGKPPEGYTP